MIRPYTEWIDEENFLIRGSYDPITDEATPVGPMKLFPFQRDISDHVFTVDPSENRLPYTTVILSQPKKSGKTTWGASIGSWFASEIGKVAPGTEIYCLAGDYEHAMGRMFADLEFDARNQEKLSKPPTQSKLVYPNEVVVEALAQEYKSASGARHALTLWDELWTYITETSRRMWAEMTPVQIPGIPISLRVIVTYAGFEGESDLLWDLYEKVVEHGEPVPELAHITKANGEPTCFRSGRIFAFWDQEHRMPWQTPEYYEEQMATLRPHEYLRLHENAWVTSHEKFIPIEWWDEACTRFPTSLDLDLKSPRKAIPVVIGVDAGAKRDSTAVIGVQYNYQTDNVDVAFHQIRTPTPDAPVDIERAVEDYILRQSENFKIAAIVYDPRHVVRSMQRLEKMGFNCVEYTQTTSNMIAASEQLYDRLRARKLGAYPDDTLREHLQFAVAEDKGDGFRIVKGDRNSRHHVDGAIALAMATLQAVKSHGVDTSKPLKVEHPDAEVSGWEVKPKEDQTHLPLPLRDGNTITAPPGGWREEKREVINAG